MTTVSPSFYAIEETRELRLGLTHVDLLRSILARLLSSANLRECGQQLDGCDRRRPQLAHDNSARDVRQVSGLEGRAAGGQREGKDGDSGIPCPGDVEDGPRARGDMAWAIRVAEQQHAVLSEGDQQV